jgi:dephospho-CoA kinase
MKKIGLTGGIGSGKTTIAGIFKSLGVPVYNSDERAKQIYFHEEVRPAVEKLLGKEAYLTEAELNKSHISSLIFGDQQLLHALNSIIHPAVGKDFEQWLSKQNAPFVIKESALLFEAGIHEKMDDVILVTAPLEVRIQRTMKRDGLTRKQVEDKVNNQMPQEEKVRMSRWVIDNSGNVLVIPQVLEIVEELTP